MTAEGSRPIKITFDGDDIEELLAIPVGPNLFQLEESPITVALNYHDILEVEPQPSGTLRFVRVVTPSPLKTSGWILPEGFIESPAVRSLLDNVTANGGNWEQTFGGCLSLHLPMCQQSAVLDEFRALLRDWITPTSHKDGG